jgi:hypothetical protein
VNCLKTASNRDISNIELLPKIISDATSPEANVLLIIICSTVWRQLEKMEQKLDIFVVDVFFLQKRVILKKYFEKTKKDIDHKNRFYIFKVHFCKKLLFFNFENLKKIIDDWSYLYLVPKI